MPQGACKKSTSQIKDRSFFYLLHIRLLVSLRASQDINVKAEFNPLKLTLKSISELKARTKLYSPLLYQEAAKMVNYLFLLMTNNLTEDLLQRKRVV